MPTTLPALERTQRKSQPLASGSEGLLKQNTSKQDTNNVKKIALLKAREQRETEELERGTQGGCHHRLDTGGRR